LNDETLASGKANQYLVEEDSLIVLLPLVGTVECDVANKVMVQAGEMLASFAHKGTTITINNPYENQLVNCLQLWFRQDITARKGVVYFDIDSNKNQLVNILQSEIKLSIGKFDGRSEAIYKLSQDKSVFVFVIQGAFEVQHRLLESRDGLWLQNVQEIEMEALSNDAIVFLIEVGRKVCTG
jgi:myo-inositol-hexaphosphate 3-phosphohydrolase